MSEARFYESIEGAFSPLLEFGYRVVDRAYSARSFGNGWITYRGPSLLLEVLRDRSQHLVEFSVPGNPATRFYYGTLREVLGLPPIEALPDMPLEDLARHVVEDLRAIEEALSDREGKNTASAVEQWQAKWEADVLGRPSHGGHNGGGS